MPQVQTLKGFSNDQVPARDGHRLLAARATVRATVRATRGRREVCSMDARPRREQKVGTLQAHGDSQPVRTGLAAQACCAGVRCTRRRARGCSNRRTGRSTIRSVQDEQKGRHVSRVTALHALPTYAFVIFSPIFSRSGRHAVLGAAYLFA